MFSRTLLVAWFCVALSGAGATETVTVKYRGPVPLETFVCTFLDRGIFIERICHDAVEQYMIIRLNGTYYHYCEIGAADVYLFLSAESMGEYFNANIKGNGSDGPFDCRTHRVPNY